MYCIRRVLKAESGYSLVEVLAAIVILTLAIIPMVGMFDAGLRGTVSSSNYDKARAFANLKMEQAKNMPFATAESSFPVASSTPDVSIGGGGTYLSNWTSIADTDSTLASDFPSSFEYQVEKQYMNLPTAASPNFTESSVATKLIRLTITVRWDSDTTYTTHGLVAE